MKRILFCFLLSCPFAVHAQQFVNPDTIYQSGDIILQKTDVYYCPFGPPDSNDTREELCNQSALFRDPDGIERGGRDYAPKTHGMLLEAWHPCGDSTKRIGWYNVWQRLFTARDKPDHSHSDIIVGSHVTNDTIKTNGYGDVIVSKNEDVDFRASGTIKMKNGFHVKHGAFFHAYIEPRWDTLVFNDDFAGSSVDQSKWRIVNGYATSAQCSFDSNASIVIDTEATDGKALDIEMWLDTGCTCIAVNENDHLDTCNQQILKPQITHTAVFQSAYLRSCPWPFKEKIAPLTAAYAHMPYGKFEFRDKIPHIQHHTNQWGEWLWEWDLSETWGGTMGVWHPSIGHAFRYGPYHGVFRRSGADHYFISSEPNWSSTNNPRIIIIDNFYYGVDPLHAGHTVDTLIPSWDQKREQGGFPSYYTDSTVTFYYEKQEENKTDSLQWTASTDGKKLMIVYRIEGANTLRFSKTYQPTSVILTTDTTIHPAITRKLNCHWDHLLNSPPDTGWLCLDDTLATSEIHSYIEAVPYYIVEGYYPNPGVVMDKDTSRIDTVSAEAYAYTPYEYHTIAMEILPHEIRVLYDSNVVRRIPDRLTPRNSRYYDWASTFVRTRPYLYPAEFDMDFTPPDTIGIDPTYDTQTIYGFTYRNYHSIAYKQRQYFERHVNDCSGCWLDKNGHPSAHHLLDYVKVWDVPRGLKIADFKQ